MTTGISITLDHGVQLIRIDRPDKKNALTGEMYAAMSEALDKGEISDDIVCHVFIGSNGVFTAGNDMNDFLRRAAELAAAKTAPALIRAPSTDFVRRLPKVTKPMIAAVDGLAVGVGVTLLLHCDLVYATPAATFRAPFVNLGIIQEAGSSLTGPSRLGYANAFELLIAGALWDAPRAKEAGMVNAIVPAADLEKHALSMAKSLASKPREALFAARRMMRGNPQDISAMIEAEIGVYSKLIGSAEAREAFASFLEKRQPDFAKARAAGKV
jgi:enoyl-CoA hydratase/carnithine racemase